MRQATERSLEDRILEFGALAQAVGETRGKKLKEKRLEDLTNFFKNQISPFLNEPKPIDDSFGNILGDRLDTYRRLAIRYRNDKLGRALDDLDGDAFLITIETNDFKEKPSRESLERFNEKMKKAFGIAHSELTRLDESLLDQWEYITENDDPFESPES